MTMTTMIWVAIIVVVFGGAFWYIFRDDKSLDLNKDGKVDLKDASAAVDKASQFFVAEVKKRAPKKAAAKKAPAAKKPRAPRKKKDG